MRASLNKQAQDLDRISGQDGEIPPPTTIARDEAPLPNRLTHNLRLFHSGQFHVQAVERKGEAVVLNPELMQHGRVEIPEVNELVDGVIPGIVRCYVTDAAPAGFPIVNTSE
jgi:hypothetical protein